MKLIPEGVSEQDLRLVDEETVNVENRLGLSLSTWESKWNKQRKRKNSGSKDNNGRSSSPEKRSQRHRLSQGQAEHCIFISFSKEAPTHRFNHHQTLLSFTCRIETVEVETDRTIGVTTFPKRSIFMSKALTREGATLLNRCPTPRRFKKVHSIKLIRGSFTKKRIQDSSSAQYQ